MVSFDVCADGVGEGECEGCWKVRWGWLDAWCVFEMNQVCSVVERDFK